MARSLVVLSCLVLLLACGGDSESQTGTDGGGTGDAASVLDARPADAAPPGGSADASVPVTGSFVHYVTTSLKMGATGAEATSYGFDLDGDDEVDNALGNILALVGGFLDVDGRLAEAVGEGQIILLHSMRADSLTSDATVTWRVLVGDPEPSPDYSGNGTFDVAAASPTNAILGGAIAGGIFEGGPSTVTIELSLLEDVPPLTVRLIAARARARVTASGCTEGKLGGAVTRADIESMLVPALAIGLNGVIAADEGCLASYADCSTDTRTLLTAFDGNGNRVITAAEILESLPGLLLFTPDIDLLDENGQPGSDGEEESVSVGLGFTCAKATFAAPGE